MLQEEGFWGVVEKGRIYRNRANRALLTVFKPQINVFYNFFILFFFIYSSILTKNSCLK